MASKTPPIDKTFIRDLAGILTETDLSEIEIEQDGMRIRVARTVQMTVTAAAPAPAPVAAASAPSAAIPSDAQPPAKVDDAITSPLVGTAYLSPEPGAKPFIEIGTTVAEGQTVMIVEAMKTFNPIPAPRAGKVTHIMVENGQPVEFGEPLLVIE